MYQQLRRAALLAGFGCVALVAGEAAARLDDWIRLGIPLTRTPDYDSDLRLQDSFGVRGRPNGRYRQWRLNEFGFRGPEMARAPAAGCQRIMVLGASETFGLYEPDGKEYPAQLRDSLRVRGCYEVVNAAIAGAGLKGIIRLWENYAADFQPAVVIVYPSPTFYLADKPSTWPAIRTLEEPLEIPFRPRLIEQFHNVWSTPSVLQRRRINRWLAEAKAGKPADWIFATTPPDRVQTFMADLDSLATSIRARGAEPVLMTHAIRFASPPKPSDEFALLDWRGASPRASNEALLGTEREAALRMRAYAAERRLCLIDIDASLTGRTEFFADFGHFTALGSASVAGLIAHQIADESDESSSARVSDAACAEIARHRPGSERPVETVGR